MWNDFLKYYIKIIYGIVSLTNIRCSETGTGAEGFNKIKCVLKKKKQINYTLKSSETNSSVIIEIKTFFFPLHHKMFTI